MRKNLVTCLLVFCMASFGMQSAQAQAIQNPKWLRYPSVSPDGKQVAFTFKGDLYKVPLTGGKAVQLTFHTAHDYMPVWSHDGSQIAFASDRYGNFDVFLMDAEGGEAKRLTFHSANELPFSFTPDGKSVVFGGVRQDDVSHRQYPTGSQPELYSVSTQGGGIKQIFTVPAEYAHYSQDGTTMLYHDKKGGENEFRKHHQSSVARDIWIYSQKDGKHTKLTDFYGENRHPLFSQDEQNFYYLSEESGSFNLHRASIANPSQKQQLTHFKEQPVRSLSRSQDGTLVFSYAGELYSFKEGHQPAKIPVEIRTQAISNNDSYASINGGVREMSISPDGKEIAFIARGEVFVTSVAGSFTKRLTNTPEQERFVQFAPDGKSVIYGSEREGRWQVFQATKARSNEPYFYAASLIEEKVLLSSDGDNYLAEISPDGKKLAFIEDRRTLKVMDLATKKAVTLLTSEHLYHMRDGDQSFSWSPDSRWILATYSPNMSNSEVVLLDVEGKKEMVNLTQSGYADRAPFFANGGKQIVWLSTRNGLRSHAQSGGGQLDIYTVFLTKDGWERYQLTKDELALAKELENINKKETPAKKNDSQADSTKEKIVPLQIDWDGIENRKARLTLFSSTISSAVLSKDGEKLYYLTRFEKGDNLWSVNLRTREAKMEIALDASGGSLGWNKDEKDLYLLAGGKITKINPETGKRDPVQIAGDLHLDQKAEMKAAFDHVWLRTKKVFYTPDFHGVNWDTVVADHRRYLPYIANEYEFTELLSEMLGELNVSHAGARYGGAAQDGDATASLGIFPDYQHAGNGIKIAEIISGGPLDRSKLTVTPGMVIERIDGELITSDTDNAKFLNRKSGKFVLLEVVDPVSGKREEITVKPISLAEENQLLYRRWVKKNQDEVDKSSGGRLGYVHISGMSDGQYRNVFDEMKGKYEDREGVIVDTRFNGGGDLVADLAMFFTGEKFLTYATADRDLGYEPNFRWIKPTLAMFNESNYSDGHCFSCGYTELGIGKTVGMPVPGTCSFAGWETLPNGVTWGVVPVSVRNKAGDWLENNETKPTFQVKNQPEIIAKGRDQQLEKAIEELLKDTK